MALVKRLVLYFPVFLIVKIDNGISLITVQTTYQKDLNLVQQRAILIFLRVPRVICLSLFKPGIVFDA